MRLLFRLRVQNKRYGPIVHQLNLHHSAEDAVVHRLWPVGAAQARHQRRVRVSRSLRRHGLREVGCADSVSAGATNVAGPRTLVPFQSAVERELRKRRRQRESGSPLRLCRALTWLTHRSSAASSTTLLSQARLVSALGKRRTLSSLRALRSARQRASISAVRVRLRAHMNSASASASPSRRPISTSSPRPMRDTSAPSTATDAELTRCTMARMAAAAAAFAGPTPRSGALQPQ